MLHVYKYEEHKKEKKDTITPMDALIGQVPAEIWSLIFYTFSDEKLLLVGEVSTDFRRIIIEEASNRLLFWFDIKTSNLTSSQIIATFIQKSSATVFPELIQHQNSDSLIQVHERENSRNKMVTVKNCTLHALDCDTLNMMVSAVSHIPDEDHTELKKSLPKLLSSKEKIPLSKKIIFPLLALFPTGNYLIFKLKFSIQGCHSFNSGAPQSTRIRDFFCFKERENEILFIFPIFRNHINHPRVQYYEKILKEETEILPPVILFGIPGVNSTLCWIIDGHHRSFAASNSRKEINFILFLRIDSSDTRNFDFFKYFENYKNEHSISFNSKGEVGESNDQR